MLWRWAASTLASQRAEGPRGRLSSGSAPSPEQKIWGLLLLGFHFTSFEGFSYVRVERVLAGFVAVVLIRHIPESETLFPLTQSRAWRGCQAQYLVVGRWFFVVAVVGIALSFLRDCLVVCFVDLCCFWVPGENMRKH